jgi:hypothetical protein
LLTRIPAQRFGSQFTPLPYFTGVIPTSFLKPVTVIPEIAFQFGDSRLKASINSGSIASIFSKLCHRYRTFLPSSHS